LTGSLPEPYEPPSSGLTSPDTRLAEQLAVVGPSLREELAAAHQAREVSLRACRDTIRQCSLAIRAVHRLLPDQVREHAAAAEASLRIAQDALEPFPRLAAAGFLHDAEKEYAEARLTAALVDASPLPDYRALGVAIPAWLNGLAEAASELRRHLLDRIRDGDLTRGSALLDAMSDCYDVLVTVDYPDAITGGLRRATDALRAVLERSRSDVTTTTLQVQLQRAIEGMSKVQLEQASATVERGWMDAAAAAATAAAAGFGGGPSPHSTEVSGEGEGAILWQIQTVVASNVTIRRGSVAAGEKPPTVEDAEPGNPEEALDADAVVLPVAEPDREEPTVAAPPVTEGSPATETVAEEPAPVGPVGEAPDELGPAIEVPQLGEDEPESPPPTHHRRFRKVWRALGLVVLALIGAAMMAAAVATLAFHLSIRPVLSASMEPTYGPGWAIITRPVPTASLKVGDIIVFTPPGQNVEYAHRIVSLTGPPAHPVIMTKGDNNPTPDAWHARLASDTTPEVIAEVPFVGRVLNALGDGVSRAAVIGALGLIVCVVGMVWIIRSGRRPTRPGRASKVGDASAG
jgi:translin